MARNPRMLGLVLSAVLALSGLVASTATAAPFTFRSDGLTLTKIFGEGEANLTVDAGTLKCNRTIYVGEQAGMENELLLVNLIFEGCKFGGLDAEVDDNGCTFEFFQDNKTEDETFDALTSISCGIGKEITVTSISSGMTKCVIHIPEQTLGTGTAFVNGEDKETGLLDYHGFMNLSGIKYSQTPGQSPGCTTADNTKNGTYVDEATFTGRNELEANTNIWLE